MDNSKAPDPLDIEVGRRVNQIRKSIGMSQERLALSIGITFQQIQKYEKGTNRISASRLCRIAATLGVKAAQLLPDEDSAGDARGGGSPLMSVIAQRDAYRDQLISIKKLAGRALSD